MLIMAIRAVAVLLVLASCSDDTKNTKDVSLEIDDSTFAGVPWKSSPDEVSKILEGKGYTFARINEAAPGSKVYSGETLNRKAEVWVFFNGKKELTSVRCAIANNAENQATIYFELLQALGEKYGEPDKMKTIEHPSILPGKEPEITGYFAIWEDERISAGRSIWGENVSVSYSSLEQSKERAKSMREAQGAEDL